MPHLTLEYSRNLPAFNPADALLAINSAMLGTGLFSEADIKSRALVLDCFAVGVSAMPRAFAHVRIALLAGRSAGQRKEMAEAVLGALKSTTFSGNGLEIQLSVETLELDCTSYAKAVING